ncbi:MAG: DNA gyrase inhibitor YacG, partial [Proteobacteria bacterium]
MQTCAVCKAALEGKATRQGPFCGPRCRTIDLGKWLGGDYVVSRPLGPEDAEGDL